LRGVEGKKEFDNLDDDYEQIIAMLNSTPIFVAIIFNNYNYPIFLILVN